MGKGTRDDQRGGHYGREGMSDSATEAAGKHGRGGDHHEGAGPVARATRPIQFRIDGDPVPQPRPKVSTSGGFARAYVPSKHPVHCFRSRVTEAARDAGLVRVDQPVAVEITAVFGRPRSHYRRSGVKPTAPLLPRPDCDNLAKAVLDALQDALGDDTRVARLTVEKGWGSEGCTTVRVTTGHDDGESSGIGSENVISGRIIRESTK
jgi:Holliday junction resolvase RusA-like endonuclease